MTTLYGLRTCDTCRKALKAFDENGAKVAFRDVRADPVDPTTLARFLGMFGERLLNTRSTTWRGLSEAERARDPAELLAAHPTLMKRPVIDGPGGLTLGWDDRARAVHLG